MTARLPPKASIEFLRHQAKRRFRAMKAQAPDCQLADAQYALAREYGFPSWSRLKAAVDRQAADRWAARLAAQGAFIVHPSRQSLWLARQDALTAENDLQPPADYLCAAGLEFGILLLLLSAALTAAWR